MALPGSSPRWREVEARLRPASVRPTFHVVPTVHRMSDELLGRLKSLRAVRPPLEDDEPKQWTVRAIIPLVAEKHGLTVNDILSVCRTRCVVHPRHEVCYEAARLTPLSLTAIGKALGGRDHTTVFHGIRAHMARTGAPSVRGIVLKPPTD
jgi:chromosomal replication initiation ATPase DnaA